MMNERRKGELPWCQLCKGSGDHKYTLGGCRCSGAAVGVWTITEVTVPCPACNGASEERRKGERRDAWRTERTAKDQRDDPDYAGKCYRPFEYGWQPGDRVRYVTQPDRRRSERRKGE